MPVRAEDVTVNEGDVTESMRRDNLRRVDRFIQTANEDEAKQIRVWSEHRLMALGAIQPEERPRKRDKVLARMAVEAVPILLTLLVVIPVVYFVVLLVMDETILRYYASGCPPTCNERGLLTWVAVGTLGFLVVFLAYYSIRKVMVKARE